MIKLNLKIYLLSFALFSLQGGFAQTLWDVQNTGISVFLEDIDFPDKLNGFAVGNGGTIIKTINGGQDWVSQNAGTSHKLKAVQFVTANTGFVVGYGGSILKTTNGGTNWGISLMGSSTLFEDVFFLDNLNGWACGLDTITDYGVVYKTVDGGVNWSPASLTTMDQNVTSIDFISTLFGYCVTADVGYFTNNGGSTWFPMTSMPGGVQYICGNMFNSSFGWFGAANGNIYFTTTGGTSWATQPTPSTTGIWSIEVIDQYTVFAVGFDGMVLKTINAGSSWVQKSAGTFTNQLINISTTDSSTVWVCGENGKVYHGYGPDTDLEIIEYLGPVTVCDEEPFEIVVKVKNNSPIAITSGVFQVLDGIDPVLTYPWSGNVDGYGGLEIINLGSITVDQSTALSIIYTGDSVPDGNSLFQAISVAAADSKGTNGPHYVCSGDAVDLYAYGGSNYYWLNATPDSSQQTQHIIATQTNSYLVEITQAGCVTTDTVEVIVAGDCGTNAFSPNGDGVNDLFVIDGVEEESNTVRIFNRWGDEIRFFSDYDNVTIAWDGRDASGTAVNDGSYYYTVETTTRSFAGFVQVMN